jgi:S-adenosyl-L-methionine hydrolase (adenosine-forming)
MKPIITVITDFGHHFPAAQMEGVLMGVNPEAKLCFVTDFVRKYTKLEAAFMVRETAKYYPPHTIHVVSVDPGNTSSDKTVIAKTNRGIFIGHDNGVLIPTLSALDVEYVVVGTGAIFENVTAFHGRDVFMNLAGEISKGQEPRGFGTEVPLASLRQMKLPENHIVHIDGFGNIHIEHGDLDVPFGSEIMIKYHEKEFTAKYQRDLSDATIGEWVISLGSYGILNLAMNQGNAAKVVGARVGEPMTLDVIQTENDQQALF